MQWKRGLRLNRSVVWLLHNSGCVYKSVVSIPVHCTCDRLYNITLFSLLSEKIIDVMETFRASKLATKRIREHRNELPPEKHDNEIMCKGFLPSLADTKTACGELEGIHVYPISPRTHAKD